MPKTKKLNSNQIIAGVYPTLNMIVLTTGLVVWAFNTFAQISYVKEQNTQIMSMVEQRYKDAIVHSDMNKERILSVMLEVKDSVKSLESRMLVPIGSNK